MVHHFVSALLFVQRSVFVRRSFGSVVRRSFDLMLRWMGERLVASSAFVTLVRVARRFDGDPVVDIALTTGRPASLARAVREVAGFMPLVLCWPSASGSGPAARRTSRRRTPRPRSQRLANILPPDLRLFFMGLLLNAVFTKSRMGEQAECMLGCGAARHSVHHDLYCSVVRDAAPREVPRTRPVWPVVVVPAQAILLPRAGFDIFKMVRVASPPDGAQQMFP